LADEWSTAVTFVIAAMILDMLDGRAARMLGADSRFGAQLDSLADLVSFGVAPGIIMYMWSLSEMGNAGWIAALIFCACAAIRLARFNVESVRDEGATKAIPISPACPRRRRPA
jgi:CDP-diacylglycerol--serine O-phosphatidyltransferase